MIIGLNRHRTLFIGDVHLGNRNCKAERLYKFLCRNDADTIYLIGDILERSMIKRWPAFHDDVLRILCDKSLNGTEIIFIPGNHDSFFRYHIGQYGNLKILNHAMHKRVNGDLMLVMHGDETDFFKLESVLWLLTKIEAFTRIHFWEMLRKFFKSAIARHTAAYERKIVAVAMSSNVFGVVCGHIHMPRIDSNEGMLYLNPGDWVYHCTAIAENYQGNFTLLQG